jgi:formylglycine-generating enzyme required for sulfatase activity
LLLSVIPPNPLTLGPQLWGGPGSPPAAFALALPLSPSLLGLTLYSQGFLVDPLTGPSLGLTNALAIQFAEPIFPGLVLIQPGTFQMGSDAPSGEPYFGSNGHKPIHQVTISQPFWMGRYEVTQAEYQALMGTNPSAFLGADRPVERVSWFNAVAYCDALNAQATALGKVPAGYQYRLPTEAEWEYAARAGTTTEFHYGPSLLCNQARFRYSYHSNSECSGWQSGTVPVGSYAPNAWGLYDLHGNVWEWCMDSWSSYTASAKTDPYVSDGPFRIIRGGSWLLNSSYCRSADRNFDAPDETFFIPTDGFRVVLAPVLEP